MTAPSPPPPPLLQPLIVFVCGVCGSGKTTVGKELARLLGNDDAALFLDADDQHPPSNVAKLRAGTPLSDADRAPWLEAVADAAVEASATRHVAVMVVACSALKRTYREALRRRVEEKNKAAAFVLLAPDESALRERLTSNPPRSPSSHVLPDPLRLLPSQLATLERGFEGEEDDQEWLAVIDGEDALAPAEEQARALARRIGGGGATTTTATTTERRGGD
jgi:gluconokinase